MADDKIPFPDDKVPSPSVPKRRKDPLGPPSLSYEIATKSAAVYRLSELMFGSLLATYAVGFIDGATAQPNPQISPPLGQLIWEIYNIIGNLIGLRFAEGSLLLSAARLLARGADYLLISVTFACLTAALYIAYHSGMLTMPQIPIKRLRWDFSIALSQACCFGLSMLVPVMFPAFLAAALFLALYRRRYEVRKLIEHMVLKRLRGVDASEESEEDDEKKVGEADEAFRKAVKELMSSSSKTFNHKTIEPLSVWQRSSWSAWFATVVLVLAQAAILLLPHDSAWVRFGGGLLVLVSGLAVIFVSGRMLRDRGNWLTEKSPNNPTMAKFDAASVALWNEILKLRV